MRCLHQRNMIGSVLFYVLYPFSRYITSRPSEASRKKLPALVYGTEVCDGCTVTTRSYTQSQTTLLDQWLSPSSWTQGKTKERMKEPSPEKKVNLRPDAGKEQLMAVVHAETKTGAAFKQSEVQAAETRNGPQPHNVEDPKKDDREIIHHKVFYVKQNTEDGCVSSAEEINTEQELGAQFQCLLMEESIYPSLLKTIQTPSLEEFVSPAELRIQESTDPKWKHIQTPCAEKSGTPAEPPAATTECWDEYVAATADEMHGGESSTLIFASLLGNTQTHLKLSMEHDAQIGWHFPAGPGLTEEVHCPLLQFPTMSYYPPIQPTVPFEITWRVWEKRDGSASAAEPALIPFPFAKTSMEFTVMSYNILAEDLLKANQELYTHCPQEVLEWSHRCILVLEEILKWAPDIVCLQEVQENHYYEYLYPALSQRGYTCVYKRRTGTKTDGCATCYRGSCFSDVSVTQLEFFRPETELLDRHNVGIVLLLRPVVTRGSDVKVMGPPLCVANTHLLFNPRRGDVKLAQLAIMLAEIDKVVKSCKAKGEFCNLILCGDFNSVPHMPLYQLITTGELYFQDLPAWMISGQEDLSHRDHCHRLFAPLWPKSLGISDSCQYTTVTETFKIQSQKPGKRQYSHDFLLQLRFCAASCVRPLDLELIPGVTDNTPDASRNNHHTYDKRFSQILRHRLDLESVYNHILPGSASPEVTTLHSEVGATVDYIFYTPRRLLTTDRSAAGGFVREGLKLIGSLSLLSEDVLWSMKGLPNDIFPSDHLSLLAKFQMDLSTV